ncbi:hypothetical protein JK359_00965 [Streptomyces actinomycinicus]|uniref:Uncharacterized protein n=1 Tax=Streptomyces actinomycinicus TaxID=1695166 RepID=A0A937ECW6_9ACTN|nr:hypothetical protein [Streptomyces actinomycinicus]MBL1080557.1 hypothetical protein [Streptomyces actinomycinicus]
MRDGDSAGPVQELQARIEAVTAGTAYRMRRTGQGFDLTVNVSGPRPQVHTYRVALRPHEKTFTMTDVVHAYDVGPGGRRVGKRVSTGRSVYVTTSRSTDGTQRYRFSSADGHRLIRAAAEDLGWRELRPTAVKIAVAAGIFGGVIALSTLVGLAIAFWP